MELLGVGDFLVGFTAASMSLAEDFSALGPCLDSAQLAGKGLGFPNGDWNSVGEQASFHHISI